MTCTGKLLATICIHNNKLNDGGLDKEFTITEHNLQPCTSLATLKVSNLLTKPSWCQNVSCIDLTQGAVIVDKIVKKCNSQFIWCLFSNTIRWWPPLIDITWKSVRRMCIWNSRGEHVAMRARVLKGCSSCHIQTIFLVLMLPGESVNYRATSL